MFLNNIELCPILWRRVSLEKHQLHAANGLAEASVGTRADRRARRGIKVDCFSGAENKEKEEEEEEGGE